MFNIQSDVISKSVRISECALQKFMDCHDLDIAELFYGCTGADYTMEASAGLTQGFIIRKEG